MSSIDPFLLARAQFGLNISFHILFPSISIALSWVLLFFKLRFNHTQDGAWMEAYRLYIKIFAICFAMGIVSGITMSFQFGTNWPGFMETVGNIAGPLLSYEVMTAFFIEATFLGIMLFGFRRVSNRTHTFATLMVALATTLSAFWILTLNSFMQTPAGYTMIDGIAHAINWFDILFNPSMPYRVVHMLLASFLTVGFMISGLSAYQLLIGIHRSSVFKSLKTGLYLSALLIPLQIIVGDMHGLNTLQYQPQKIAAMEGIWHTETGAALRLFAVPDEKEHTHHFEIKIPRLSSLILKHDVNGRIQGLTEFKDHPAMTPLFFSFRIMVGTAFLMLWASWQSSYQWIKKQKISPFMTRTLIGMTFIGWLPILAGWYTTEIGRQPWLVTGILKTKDAVASVPPHQLSFTFTLYLILYILLLLAYVATSFHLAKSSTPQGSQYA